MKHVKSFKWRSTKVKILTPKDIEKKWLGLIEAVWKWSENKPYVVILEKIIDKKLPTYWLVWKWITFDSGWIQVKPWDHMYEMKGDMCWAATAYALMRDLDRTELKVNMVTCIMLAENAVSSSSYRPSDILKSYSWKTVDIIHTDAEWRLVLADGVSYLSKNYSIDNIMTIATLTGACMMALGYRYAAVMWDDRITINTLLKQSKKSYEKYCELPFDNYFIDKCKSEIADLENLNRWVYAWSTMWGAFLYHFLMNWEKYTHLDIAWTALNGYEAYGVANKWMTWFWVESLWEFFKSLK
jgi:leucyl aminopeptidase